MFGSLLALLFPQRCRICGKRSADPVCAACVASFPTIAASTCARCGKPCLRPTDECRECAGKALYFSAARAGGSYDGALKEAIRRLKYGNGKLLAPSLARFTAPCASGFIERVDAVAYVPLTKRKEALRGYNQSKLIAEELASVYGKPMYHGLVKTRSIPEQNKLGLVDRSSNVAGAFSVRTACAGALLLVDDVYTTGSTVNECARVLRNAGAAEVLVVTVARTPLRAGKMSSSVVGAGK